MKTLLLQIFLWMCFISIAPYFGLPALAFCLLFFYPLLLIPIKYREDVLKVLVILVWTTVALLLYYVLHHQLNIL